MHSYNVLYRHALAGVSNAPNYIHDNDCDQPTIYSEVAVFFTHYCLSAH